MSIPDTETSPDPQTPGGATPAHAARQRWMAILARASAEELLDRLAACPALPSYARLRGPETGLVMVRGREGGGGPAFNLGEMSVTRCTVRSAGGQVGHAYVSGRDARQAELAARFDAALQDASLAPEIERIVVAPLAAAQRGRRAADAARAAATKVQFFTMATMRS
jgi:alpha-D-ribose 1-methylphosphonate 5-triphosphate synthase subunit PhnG